MQPFFTQDTLKIINYSTATSMKNVKKSIQFKHKIDFMTYFNELESVATV